MLEINQFNIALLRKWIWCLCYKKNGLWKDVLDSKYGGWRELMIQRKCRLNSIW